MVFDFKNLISAIDPVNLALSSAPFVYDATLGARKARKTRTKQIKNEYIAEKAGMQKEVSSFLSDSSFRTLAGGGKEGALAPSLNALLTKNLEDLRKRKTKEIEAL